ncbi:alpha-hydroxy acid oxidase [Ottowia sp. VDI28]|uniref:alpha-hydroxy acid oxidase n=1 Tax=Ottowia sp. VDI28 TaxID=3133968 RepID=UPI003C2BADC5
MFGTRRHATIAARAHCIEDLRQEARRYLPRVMFDFFDGGAEEEQTLSANRQAFKETYLRPRVLNNVERVNTEIDLLGLPARFPICIAPTGGVGYGRRGGDIAIAKAAARFGIPYTLSTSATASIEQVAEAAPGRLWFQAYILKDQAFLHKLIERARVAEYEALMITVDLPVGGKRERDLRNGFRAPFKLTPQVAWDGIQHPRWAAVVAMRGFPFTENLRGLDRAAPTAANAASAVGRNYDPTFDWDRLRQLRDLWPRKLVVKGVMCADDAQRLADMGCDAIIVSNHGGRQLDGAMATFRAFPEVLRGAGGRIPVLVDGGVRRGVDVLKACAAGARGVLIGRATLFGAMAAGQAGAERALEILTDELARSMRLCGVADVAHVTADLIGS